MTKLHSSALSMSSVRLAAAFVLAPLTASFLMAILEPAYAGLHDWAPRILHTTLANAVIGGYPAAFILGLPAYMFLRKSLRPTMINCMLAGGVVAAAPWFFAFLFLPGPDEAFSAGHVTYHLGHATPWGWAAAAIIVVKTAFFGSLGGAVFWAVAAAEFQTVPSQTL
jgi:hypothetical protein